jgi:hypothetical protein
MVAPRETSITQELKKSRLTPALRASSLIAQQRAAREILVVVPEEWDSHTGRATWNCSESGRFG